MNLTAKKILLTILAIVLVVEIGFIFMFVLTGSRKDMPAETVAVISTEPTVTESVPAETVPPTETVAPTETVPPTEPPVTEPPATEPKEKHYTLSFAGDCTMGSTKANWNNPVHYIQTIG